MKPAHKQIYKEIKMKHHDHFIWSSAALLSMSAILFSLELLAMAGVLGVLGAAIQGLGDTND